MYDEGTSYFVYGDRRINFEEIDEIVPNNTKRYMNGVYQHREKTTYLKIKDEKITLTAKTSDLEKYKQLTKLTNAIIMFTGKSIDFNAIEENIKQLELKLKLWKYFLIIVIPFGINGLSEIWFNTSLFRHTEPIHTLSLISGMLLGIWIIVTPFGYVAEIINERKLQREEDFLAGRESSVKDININFENIIIVALVAGLIYLIYQQVV